MSRALQVRFIYCNGYFIQLFICIRNKQLFSCRSNHRRIRLLDKSSLTIIAANPSCFYNNSMSSLNNEVNQSTMSSYSRKHTFEMTRSFCRPLRMRACKFKQYICLIMYFYLCLTNLIMKFVAKSNAGTPVLAYLRGFSATSSLGRRYARPF